MQVGSVILSMDKTLVLKLLGKNDSVILEDQVFNLRDILDSIRLSIITDVTINHDDLDKISKRLDAIANTILPMKDKLEGHSIIGYTNSKLYLAKYINSLISNIEHLKNSINPFNNREFVFYTNTLMDLVLTY